MIWYTIPKMDSSTATPKKTDPVSGEKKDTANIAELRSSFFVAALSMGWQLAVVVVIPIVGGYYLDQRLNVAAAWEIVGFVVALLGFIVVVRQQLNDFNQMTKQEGRKKK